MSRSFQTVNDPLMSGHPNLPPGCRQSDIDGHSHSGDDVHGWEREADRTREFYAAIGECNRVIRERRERRGSEGAA